MKLRSLTVENFRRFREPYTLTGLTDGLNLVCEPNEAGKSTLLEAMRAALFVRHRSSAANAYWPYGERTSPKVRLEFDLPDGRWTLDKKFMPSAAVQLFGPDGVRYQSDEAEAKLQTLLDFEHGSRGASANESGVLGLLWVEQATGFAPNAPGDKARRTIQSLLAREIGAVTGGRRAQAVQSSVDTALGRLQTTNGTPRGDLAQAQQSVGTAVERVKAAETHLAKLDGVLGQLESERRELARIEKELADPEVDAAIARWTSSQGRAALTAASMTAAEAISARATDQHRRALDQLAQRTRDIAHKRETGIMAAAAATTLTLSLADLEPVRDFANKGVAALTKARADTAAAQSDENQSQAAWSAVRRDYALCRAFERFDSMQVAIKRQRELEMAIGGTSIDANMLEAIEVAEGEYETARAMHEVSATRLRFRLTELGRRVVRVAGVVPDDEILLGATTTVALGELGELTLVPPTESVAGSTAPRDHAKLERDRLLAAAGAADLVVARRGARQRQNDEIELKQIRIEIERGCPADRDLTIAAGFAALESFLLRFARPPVDNRVVGEEDVVAARTRTAAARSTEQLDQATHDEAQRALTTAESDHLRLTIALTQADKAAATAAELLRLAEAEMSQASLDQTAADAGAKSSDAADTLANARLAADGLDVDAINRKLATAQRLKANLKESQQKILVRLAGLVVEAQSIGGTGPASALDRAHEDLLAVQLTAARMTEDAAVLKLLKQVLDDVSADAARMYLEPVTRRVNPYVRRLLPGANLMFSEELAAESLFRAGHAEPTASLSRGTQEQLAVLTRLGFAELLAERGSPASVVLDDSLVFSDDDRLDAMIDILAEASKHTQIIVLSCRGRAFRGADASVISMRIV